MARPKNKAELLEKGEKSFEDLLELVASFSSSEVTKPGVNGEWSVKDVLAHLYAWNEMLLGWYKEGMAGGKPEMPAPGFTWKMTPQLNEKIFKEHKSESFDKVLKDFKTSHAAVTKFIKKHTDKELFTKKKYAWTGSTSMAVYFRASTSSHHEWAIGLIKRAKKGYA